MLVVRQPEKCHTGEQGDPVKRPALFTIWFFVVYVAGGCRERTRGKNEMSFDESRSASDKKLEAPQFQMRIEGSC